jgi:RNA polymerase sigma-70 factor, ECF subfamily
LTTETKHETQLVLRAQCGDREALESLLRSVQTRLLRYIAGLVGRDAAEDVLQDVFLQICRKLEWLRGAELFRPWIYRIASRASFAFLKKKRLWMTRDSDDVPLDELPAPPSNVLPAMLGDLTKLVEDLSPASRNVLLLHYVEGLTLDEAAAVLEVNSGTVKSRLAYGLSCLRKSLERKE